MYTLYVERIDDRGCFHREYEIPAPGIDNYDDVVKFAKKIGDSLKERYVVHILKIKKEHICFMP